MRDLETFNKLPSAANADPEFRIAARFWHSTLRLEMGETALLIQVRDGQISDVTSGHQAFDILRPSNIVISASVGDWQNFLERVPKPFYVDLFGAVAYHGFKVAGDMENLYAYYPAVRRLFDIMRSLAN
jgi:hypothetical protein